MTVIEIEEHMTYTPVTHYIADLSDAFDTFRFEVLH